jgi:hypothetical protein
LLNNGYLFPINKKTYVPEEIICTYLQTWGETTIANELIDYMNKKNNETTTKKILHTSDKCSIYL